MSFSFAPPRVPPVSSMGWQATAAAWRGCCLEVFSRAEHSIDDCISELEVRGRCVGRDAHHPLAGARRNALVQYLKREQFSPQCPPTVRKLEEWHDSEAERRWFAHGRMIVRPSEIEFSLRSHDGKVRSDPVARIFSPIEMLAFIRQIDDSQRVLHRQLGHVKAAARKQAEV